MFKIENNVPDVYVNESRDFQLLCRLGDLVIQSSRFSINSMTDVSSTKECNSAALELLKTKLGFFEDESIDDSALRVILASYPYLIKAKGTIKAIQILLNMFMRITSSAVIDFSIDNSSKEVTITLTKSTEYYKILYSILQKIIPAGYKVLFYIQTSIEIVEPEYSLSSATDVVKIDDVYKSVRESHLYYNIIPKIADNPTNFGSRVGTSLILSIEDFNDYSDELDKENS